MTLQLVYEKANVIVSMTRESFSISLYISTSSRSPLDRVGQMRLRRRRCGGKCPPEITRLTAARLSDRTVGFTVFAEI